jgi:hypothetical protein
MGFRLFAHITLAAASIDACGSRLKTIQQARHKEYWHRYGLFFPMLATVQSKTGATGILELNRPPSGNSPPINTRAWSRAPGR